MSVTKSMHNVCFHIQSTGAIYLLQLTPDEYTIIHKSFDEIRNFLKTQLIWKTQKHGVLFKSMSTIDFVVIP